MAVCANCIHFDIEHEYDDLGAPCEARYGAWGESDYGQVAPVGERCDCPGFYPEP